MNIFFSQSTKKMLMFVKGKMVMCLIFSLAFKKKTKSLFK